LGERLGKGKWRLQKTSLLNKDKQVVEQYRGKKRERGKVSVPFRSSIFVITLNSGCTFAQALPNLTLLSRKAELRSFVPESQIPTSLAIRYTSKMTHRFLPMPGTSNKAHNCMLPEFDSLNSPLRRSTDILSDS